MSLEQSVSESQSLSNLCCIVHPYVQCAFCEKKLCRPCLNKRDIQVCADGKATPCTSRKHWIMSDGHWMSRG